MRKMFPFDDVIMVRWKHTVHDKISRETSYAALFTEEYLTAKCKVNVMKICQFKVEGPKILFRQASCFFPADTFYFLVLLMLHKMQF